jgi:hypothetical protein
MVEPEFTPPTEPSGALVPPPPKPPTAVAAMTPPAPPPPPRPRRRLDREIADTAKLAVSVALDALDRMGDAIAEATGLRRS